jgi:hypothetical protein
MRSTVNWTALFAGGAVSAWFLVGVAALIHFDGLEAWFYRYQSLLGVAVAASALCASIFNSRRQMAQAQDNFERQLRMQTEPVRLMIDRNTATILKLLGGVTEALAAFRPKVGENDKEGYARLRRALGRLESYEDVFKEILPYLNAKDAADLGKFHSKRVEIDIHLAHPNASSFGEIDQAKLDGFAAITRRLRAAVIRLKARWRPLDA